MACNSRCTPLPGQCGDFFPRLWRIARLASQSDTSMIASMDARLYQISVLGALLVYGIMRLDFEVTVIQSFVSLASVLLVQWTCTRLMRLPRFEWRSAMISGLSLCLLCRANSLAL